MDAIQIVRDRVAKGEVLREYLSIHAEALFSGGALIACALAVYGGFAVALLGPAWGWISAILALIVLSAAFEGSARGMQKKLKDAAALTGMSRIEISELGISEQIMGRNDEPSLEISLVWSEISECYVCKSGSVLRSKHLGHTFVVPQSGGGAKDVSFLREIAKRNNMAIIDIEKLLSLIRRRRRRKIFAFMILLALFYMFMSIHR
jgi:hypothetical protein